MPLNCMIVGLAHGRSPLYLVWIPRKSCISSLKVLSLSLNHQFACMTLCKKFSFSEHISDILWLQSVWFSRSFLTENSQLEKIRSFYETLSLAMSELALALTKVLRWSRAHLLRLDELARQKQFVFDWRIWHTLSEKGFEGSGMLSQRLIIFWCHVGFLLTLDDCWLRLDLHLERLVALRLLGYASLSLCGAHRCVREEISLRRVHVFPRRSALSDMLLF